MKLFHLFYIILVLFVVFPSDGMAKKRKTTVDKPQLEDAILKNMIFYAPFYEKIVDDYTGEVYMKGRINVVKKNPLIRVIPSMFRMEKGIREYMAEALADIHYTAPDLYDVKMKAISGTFPTNKGISTDIQNFFRINVYSSSLLSNKLYSPLAENGPKYYRYYLDSIIGKNENLKYKVLVVAKNKSSQLVNGYVIVNANLWTVSEMYIEGETEFLRFKVKVEMGDKGDEEFLIKKVDANMYYNFVGNKLEGDFNAAFKYDEIILSDKSGRTESSKNKYDLTEYFSLTLDSTTSLTDNEYFEEIRPLPLSENEEKIYHSYNLRRDTTKHEVKIKTPNQIFFGRLGDILLTNYTVNLADYGTVRFSPLLNPLLLSYSHSNGYSYRQDFRYHRNLKADRWLRIRPRIGYNFTRKEFYWSVNTTFDYWPKKLGMINLNFGNGNRIYSSDVLDDIQNVPDSIFDFDNLDLGYFKDLFFVANHEVEVTNGFKITAGLITHKRTPVKKIQLPEVEDPEIEQEISKLPSKYISIAPRIRLELTPALYYYKNRNRKINLYSKYPTFSLDWERGIKGIFGSTGEYERIEFDMQHKLQLGLMRILAYRAGFGLFTNQKQMYFVDFANFARNNLPVGWNDDIGGVFQLLDHRWYNSSKSYVRGHLTYESPFLIWPHLIKYTSLIENERLYLSILFVPRLTPYIEFGYGIGTHIFDLGFFVSNINGRFSDIGMKFTFELFNR